MKWKHWHVVAWLVWLWCLCWCASAAEVIPPVPTQYFNDYAGVVSSATAQQLNQALEDFEKQTSSQVVVAVYPKMESDSSIDDYAVRVFEAWKPGLHGKDNGAVLLVFVQDRKMRIATGYGLEGALPDALAKRIIDEVIAPRFKAGDYDGGLAAGVGAIMMAIRGEYQGTGQTVAQSRNRGGGSFLANYWFLLLFLLFFLLSAFPRRRRRWYGGGWVIGGGGIGGWPGGGWPGGGGGGTWGGGGGFSGGGGSTGGGGASGSW